MAGAPHGLGDAVSAQFPPAQLATTHAWKAMNAESEQAEQQSEDSALLSGVENRCIMMYHGSHSIAVGKMGEYYC